MYVDIDTIIKAAALLTALVTLAGAGVAVVRWFDRKKQQDTEIAELKEEQCLLTYGVLACLKGLQEKGCNGPVTEAIGRLEKHINKKAHDQK